MRLRRRCSDDSDNGGGGVLKTRVSRQKQSSKEKEEERPLNKFYSNKNAAHQAHLNTAWERNDSFLTTTDTAEMTDSTLLHNGTVQRVDFRLIHPAQRYSYHITTKRTISPGPGVGTRCWPRAFQSANSLPWIRPSLTSSRNWSSVVVGAGQIFWATLMAINFWFSITESDASSSTKVAWDLLADFFLPIY